MGKKKKKTVVSRKFLTDLATLIYDSKHRRFLRLCNGTLQNGPDPEDASRPMHCGLGELYFAMTGRQPQQDHVSEEDVIDKAVELSTLPKVEEQHGAAVKRATKAIKALGLPTEVTNEMIDTLENSDEDLFKTTQDRFREALDDIPGVNDACPSPNVTCETDTYRERSKRVAAQLRKAAKLLPA